LRGLVHIHVSLGTDRDKVLDSYRVFSCFHITSIAYRENSG
jgi:hypothetical protein